MCLLVFILTSPPPPPLIYTCTLFNTAARVIKKKTALVRSYVSSLQNSLIVFYLRVKSVFTCCGLYYLSELICSHIPFTHFALTMLAPHCSSTIPLSQDQLTCWSLCLKCPSILYQCGSYLHLFQALVQMSL